MHYYQHHIGDFIKDTANLNDHQLATYLRMLWSYYSEERPLGNNLEDIAFAMRSDEKTIGLILRHYFKLAEDGWHHGRCDREIAEFNAKKDKAAASANARWKNAKNKTNVKLPQCDGNANASKTDANQEPITINQEPKDKPPVAPQGAASDEAFARFWQEYPKRYGGNSKANALKAWKARVREGASPVDLIEAAKRYAKQQEALGKVGTEYVKQAATFLGPAGHWQDALTSETAPVRPAQGVHHAATHQGMTDLSWMRDKRDDQ